MNSTSASKLFSGITYAVAERNNLRRSSLDASALISETHAEQLADCILQRIESRLPCRIRDLKVYVSENAVVLEGLCSTYYSKQIAQHAAMGVLEYERLINNIEVRPAK
ncbi:MAG: hypothetical protein KDA57_03945 [Planctomycetales bacterium]|nr:hypothetical protein [Planctomycetales bacterium]